jgi:carbon-monoxide dehydrogenase medium subunit
MYNFDVEMPGTVADAVQAMSRAEAQPMSGGQTLIPTLKARLAAPSVLVSLTGIDEMKGVCMDDAGRLCIGGATTHARVAAEAAAHYPALASLAARIGDPAVRNRGTIGCYPAGALGSGATITTNKREIAADDYFQGMFETALEEGEIVTEVKFPVPTAAHYEKFLQPASRFPLVAAYVAKFGDGVRVAITGASNNGVFRWGDAETALAGNFSADAIAGLSVESTDMISDLHGTAEYRAHLIAVMTKRAVAAIG